jgi:hypothetical protein
MTSPHTNLSPGSVAARWIAGTSLGFAIGIAAGRLVTLAAQLLAGVDPDRFIALATLICLGLSVGLVQQVVIAAFLPKPERWLPATFIGYLLALVPFAIPVLPRFASPGVLGDALLFCFAGAANGLGQWWILRSYFPRSGLWVLATAVGFLSFIWLRVYPAQSFGELLIMGSLLGGVSAVAPGALLVSFVRRPLLATS